MKIILGTKSDLTESRAVTAERGKEVGGGYIGRRGGQDQRMGACMRSEKGCMT